MVVACAQAPPQTASHPLRLNNLKAKAMGCCSPGLVQLQGKGSHGHVGSHGSTLELKDVLMYPWTESSNAFVAS